MKKIIVIGSPGAGKSTFSRKLKSATGLPLYYLDMLWHKENKTTVTRQEFDSALAKIVAKDEWIIDGNYGRTLEMRLKECDTVFLFDLAVDVCIDGAKSRIGRKREDMPWIETELDKKFEEWITSFPQNELPRVYEKIEKYRKNINLIIFKSRKEADEWLCNTFS